MALGSQPTSRWRRWVLLGIVATIVVLAVNAAMSARSPVPVRQLAEATYLDRVLPIIDDSTQEGMDIDTVRTQAPSLGATSVGERLRTVAARAAATLDEARRLSAPASVRTGHDLLVAALAIRANGAAAFRDAMVGAVSGQGSSLPVKGLVDAGRDFDAGDRAYALFVRSTPRLEVPLPASVWLHDPSAYEQSTLTVFLTTLRSAASLAPVHDTAVVAVTTDPAPVGMNGTTEILPAGRVLDMQVVVADLGNQPEPHVTVTATITWSAPTAGASPQSVRNFADLAAGQSRTVSVGGLHPPTGVPVTLTVAVEAVAGETSTADNAKVIAFVMQ